MVGYKMFGGIANLLLPSIAAPVCLTSLPQLYRLHVLVLKLFEYEEPPLITGYVKEMDYCAHTRGVCVSHHYRSCTACMC